jgi:hypothetical protein
MNKKFFLVLLGSLLILSSCWTKTQDQQEYVKKEYSVATSQADWNTSWNGEKILVYSWEELVLTKEPEDGLGNYEQIVWDKLFVSYGTSPVGRILKIFSVPSWDLVWEAKYDTPLNIDSTTWKVNLPVLKDEAPSSTSCENYEEISKQAEENGMWVHLIQETTYDSVNNIETKGLQYCVLSQ